MIVDCAIYVDGHRSAPCSPGEMQEACRMRGGFAWIGLYDPTQEEFDSVAGELGLPRGRGSEVRGPRKRSRASLLAYFTEVDHGPRRATPKP